MAQTPVSQAEAQMKTIVQNLYNLIAQAYEHDGASTEAAMKREITTLVNNLIALAEASPNVTVEIPKDIITYVQEGRNPDIYTREFVEVVMKNNQRLKGKSDAFAQFRDVLACEFAGGVPDLADEIRQVVESTGGEFRP